jgi:hypothetical protein
VVDDGFMLLLSSLCGYFVIVAIALPPSSFVEELFTSASLDDAIFETLSSDEFVGLETVLAVAALKVLRMLSSFLTVFLECVSLGLTLEEEEDEDFDVVKYPSDFSHQHILR